MHTDEELAYEQARRVVRDAELKELELRALIRARVRCNWWHPVVYAACAYANWHSAWAGYNAWSGGGIDPLLFLACLNIVVGVVVATLAVRDVVDVAYSLCVLYRLRQWVRTMRRTFP